MSPDLCNEVLDAEPESVDPDPAGPPRTVEPSPPSEAPSIHVWFDGACPVCRRARSIVGRLDRQGAVCFSDIASPEFDARAVGLDPVAVNTAIHARLVDGTVVTGVEVLRQVGAALGVRQLVDWSRRTSVSRFLDASYGLFARHRGLLKGRLRRTRQ